MTKLLFLVFILSLNAQSFEEFKKAESQQFNNYIQHYDNLLDYLDRESLAFKEIQNEIYLIWGDKKVSNSKTWVAYSKNKHQRIFLNYEDENSLIQIKSQKNKNETILDIKKFILHIESSINETDENSVDIVSNSIEVTENEIEKNITRKKVNNDFVYEIKLPFKKGAFNKRVQRVLPFVQKYSKEYDLDPRRVLAQIHAESAFNPRAVSSANAYGLMQLVPRFGGKEAKSYLLKSEIKPSIKELFNSEYNIKLGCTYIHILNTKYFNKIENKQSLEYLTISAYNTGPENVFRSFNKNSAKEKIKLELNQSSSNIIYNHLLKNLPYLETRKYLKSVLNKKKLYTKI